MSCFIKPYLSTIFRFGSLCRSKFSDATFDNLMASKKYKEALDYAEEKFRHQTAMP